MTQYCTQQDLIDRATERELVQLTDETGQGIIDTTKVTRAIDDASATIDGFLEGRYTLPLSVVPRVLTRYACDLARYYLHDGAAMPEVVEARYKETMDYLRRVARGEVGLGLDPAGEQATGAGGPQFEAPDRVFDADTLKDF